MNSTQEVNSVRRDRTVPLPQGRPWIEYQSEPDEAESRGSRYLYQMRGVVNELLVLGAQLFVDNRGEA
jgi:hypothetical protein